MSAERLGTAIGLAVLASDALSSVAYATEEILLALVLAGTAGLPYTLPAGIAIAVLIPIVATSYRQTIIEYPDGGGAYRVAHENLGVTPGLIAGAAMLTDYVLTVAVSTTAGVAAVISAFPVLEPHRIMMAVLVIVIVALTNLRGATVIVPVAGIHRGVLRALRFALGLNCPVVAVHVSTSDEAAEKLRRQWDGLDIHIPLEILESPYRSLAGPLLDYVDQALARDPDAFVAVVIPEFVPAHWRHAFLHNQSALLLEFALRSRPQAALISIRYLLSSAVRDRRQPRQPRPRRLLTSQPSLRKRRQTRTSSCRRNIRPPQPPISLQQYRKRPAFSSAFQM